MIFQVLILSFKGRFLFVTFFDPHLIINFYYQIKLEKLLKLILAIEQFVN